MLTTQILVSHEGVLLAVADSSQHVGDHADAHRVRLRTEQQPLPQQHARLRRAADGALLHLADGARGEL